MFNPSFNTYLHDILTFSTKLFIQSSLSRHKEQSKASVLQKKSSFTIYCFSPASPGAPLHPPQEIQREVKSKSQKGKSEITDDKKNEIEGSQGSYRHINRYEVQIANTPSPTKIITLLKSSTT